MKKKLKIGIIGAGGRAWGIMDMLLARHGREDYDINLFAALRSLMSDKRKLVLLIVSRTPLDALLPRDNPLSAIQVKTVELRGRA